MSEPKPDRPENNNPEKNSPEKNSQATKYQAKIGDNNEIVDFTESFQSKNNGARNPLNLMIEKFEDFFISLGWQVETGPELESEWYNFDSLNFAPDHPARNMQDTFFIKGGAQPFTKPSSQLPAQSTVNSNDQNSVQHLAPPSELKESQNLNQTIENPNQPNSLRQKSQSNMVLRTHTSPVQTRSMLKRGAPLYIVCPGKCYRTDELDQTHSPMFHQIEGLAIDKNITMADLKGTLDYLAKFIFGPQTKTRFRPSYFPFTEPSAEMDIWFEKKKGGAGWIEWLGCGMTHENVLLSSGIDPKIYQGFAFGIGIERTLMLKHSIQDMHDIVEGDVRFADKFGMQA